MAALDEQLQTAARIVGESSYLIALVGAGMSKESGIPTFRGGDGLWDKHGEPPMDGYQRLLEDPEAWWKQRQEQQERRQGDELMTSIEEAQPNPGHLALAEMERRGILKHIITQNIDNLHQEAGSMAITEIHGNRTKMRCIECMRRWTRDEFAVDASPSLNRDGPPLCPGCDGLVKGDTVMFGEPIPRDALDSCFEHSRRADAVLLLGTSAVVYPAAEFPVIVYRNGGKLIEVNPQDTPLSELCSAVLRAPSGEILPALLEAVASRSG